MSTTIDNRVVKLIFDSEQFQKGIKKTQDTLKDFEKSLKLDKASEGLDKLKTATDKLNFKALGDKFKEQVESIKNSTKKASDDIEGISKSADKVDLKALGKEAEKASKDVESAAKNASDSIEKIDDTASNVDFSDISKAANDTVSKVNNAADSTDFSPMIKSADTAADGINEAARSIDLSPVVSEIQEANRGFNAMQEIAVGALRKIGGEGVEFVVNKLKGLANAAIKPVIDGFGEYEQQMGSIQTILANTTGGFDNAADIQNVNDKLYELNKYADETIYSFSDMTAAIGRFTAAGVGKENLQEAVDAVKGVSGVAALQGATRSDVHRVLPQIAQALSAGQVTLQDWRSIETASMGGKSFVDALADMAIHMASTGQASGTAKTVGEKLKNGELSMREALNQKDYGVWLNSDILANTFRSFAIDSRDKKSVEENLEWLKSIGYSMDEALDIIKRSDLARRSAQEVRTFTQLKDTMAEGLGSNWAQIWQNFIGDFKQATDTFTYLSDFLGKRIDGFFSGIVNISEHFKKSGAIELIFGSIVRDENGKPIINEVTNEIERVGGALDNVLNAIFKPLDAIGQAFKEVFAPIFEQSDSFIALDGMLIGLAKAIRDATASLVISDDAAEAIKSFWVGLFQILKLVLKLVASVVSAVAWAVGNIRKVLDPILDIVWSIIGVIGKVVGWLAEKIGEVVDAVQIALKPVADAISAVFDVVGGILQRLDIDNKIMGLGDLIVNVLEGIWRFVDIPNIIMGIGDAIGNILHFIGDITGWNAAVEETDTIMNELGEEVSVVDVWFARLMDNPVIQFFKGIFDAISFVIKGIGGIVSAIFGLNKEGQTITLGGIFRDLANVISKVVLAPFKALSYLVFGVFALIYKLGSAIVNFFGIGDKLKALGGIIVSAATAIGGALKTAWDKVVGFFKGIYDAFTTGGIAGIQAKIQEYQKKITDGFKNLWQGVKESDFFKGAKAIVDGFSDSLSKAGIAISDLWAKAKEFFKGVGEAVGTYFGGVIDTIGRIATGAAQFVAALWMVSENVPQFLYYLVYYGISAIIDAIKWALYIITVNILVFIRDLPKNFDNLRNALAEKFNALKEFFLNNPLVQGIHDMFFGVKSAVDTAAGGVQNAFDKVTQAPTRLDEFKRAVMVRLYGIRDSIMQAVENIKQFLLNNPIAEAIRNWYAGVNEASGDQTTIWGKLANSFDDMRNMFSGFKTWVSELGQNIVGFVKPIWDSTRTIPEFVTELFKAIGVAIVNGAYELRRRIALVFQDVGAKLVEIRDTIGQVVSSIPSKLKEIRDTFVEKAKEVGSAIYSSVTSFADNAKRNIALAAGAVGYAIDNVVTGIKSKAGEIKEGIKNAFGVVSGWVQEKFGVFLGKAKEIFKKVRDWFSVSNLIDKLFGKIKSVLEGINGWLQEKSKTVAANTESFMKKVDESIVKPFEEIKKTLGQIKQNSIIGVLEEKFKTELDALAHFINNIPAMLEELFVKVDSPAFDRLITLLNTLFGGKLTLSIAGIFTNIGKVIKSFKKVGKGFNGLGQTLSKSIETNSNKIGNSFTKASTAFGKTLGDFFNTYESMTKLAQKKAKNENRKIFTEALKNIAISMAIVGATIALISLVPDPRLAAGIMVGVGALLLVMQWLSSLITKHYKKHRGGTELIKAAASLGVFALSIILMMRTIKKLTEFDFNANAKGLIAAGGILLILSVISGLMARLGGKGGKHILESAVGVAVLVFSLGSIVKSFKKMNKFLEEYDWSKPDLVKDQLMTLRNMMGSCVIIMLGMAAAMKIADSKTVLSTSIAFVFMTHCLKNISKALQELTSEQIDVWKLVWSLVGIGVVLAEFVTTIWLIQSVKASDVKKAGTAFIRYGIAIRLIAGAIKPLAKENINIGNLITAMLGLALLVGEFVWLCNIIAKSEHIDAKMMKSISIAFVVYGAAVLLISKAISSLMGAITDKMLFSIVVASLVGIAYVLGIIVNQFQGFKAGQILSITMAIGVYALAICLIANAIAKVAEQHYDKLDIATISGCIGGLMTIMALLAKSMTDKNVGVGRSTWNAGKILSFALAIGAYAVSIGVIAEAITKVAKNHFEKLDIATISGCLGGLMLLYGIINKMLAQISSTHILITAVAIYVYAMAVERLGESLIAIANTKFDIEQLKATTIALGSLVALFGGLAKILAKVKYKQILGATAGLNVYAYAITTLSEALIALNQTKMDIAQIATTTGALAGLVLMFGGLAKMVEKIKKTQLAAIAVSMVLYAWGVTVLAEAIIAMNQTKMDIAQVGVTTGCVAGLVAMFGLLGKMLNQISAKDLFSIAGSLVVYSGAIYVIAKALMDIAGANLDNAALWNATGAIAALIGEFILLNKVLTAVKVTEIFAVAGSMVVYGFALGVIGNAIVQVADNVPDTQALWTIAGSMAVLVGVFGLMAKFVTNGVNAIAIAAAVGLYGISLEIMANALGSLAEYDPSTIQGIAIAMGGLVGVFALAGLIGSKVAIGMIMFAGGLAVVSAALMFLGEVIKAFPDYDRVREFGRSIIGGLVGGFVEGVGDAIMTVINVCKSIFNAIIHFFDIRSPSHLMHDKVGLMITEGLSNGIDEGSSNVGKSVDNMMGDMSGRIEDGIPDMTVDLTPEMSQNEKSLMGMYDFELPEQTETPDYSTYYPDEDSFDSLDALTEKTNTLSDMDFSNFEDFNDLSANMDLSNMTSQFEELGDAGEDLGAFAGLPEEMGELEGMGDIVGGLGEDFGGLGEDIGGFGDAMDGAGGSLGDFNDQLGSLGDTMDEMGGLDNLENFGESIPDTIGEGMENSDWNVSDAISKLFGGGEEGEEGLLDGAKETVEGLGGEASGWFGSGFLSGNFNLGDAIKGLIFGQEGSEDGGILQKVKDAMKGIPEKLGGWFGTDVLPTLKSWKENFWGWVENEGLPALGDFIMKIPERLGQLGEVMSKWYEEHGKPIIDKAGAMLKDWWENTAKPAMHKFFTETIPNKLGELKDAVGKWITDNVEKLKKKAAEKLEEIKKNIGEWFEGTGIPGITKKLGEVAEGIGKWFSELPTNIGKFVTDITSRLGEIGGNIIQGIVDGFTQNDIVQWVTGKINEVGNTITNGFNSFFHINSPSKLMRDTTGKSIVEGIGDGMTKYSAICTKATKKIGSNTVTTFKSEMSKLDTTAASPKVTPVVDMGQVKKNLAATTDTMSTMSLNTSSKLEQQVQSNVTLSGIVEAIRDHRIAVTDKITGLGEGVTRDLAKQTDDWRTEYQVGVAAIGEIAEKVNRMEAYADDMFKALSPSDLAAVLQAISEYTENTMTIAMEMEGKGTNVYMDTGALVGAIAPEMDNALGMRQVGTTRGYGY